VIYRLILLNIFKVIWWIVVVSLVDLHKIDSLSVEIMEGYQGNLLFYYIYVIFTITKVFKLVLQAFTSFSKQRKPLLIRI
jgi:hypothetical protein